MCLVHVCKAVSLRPEPRRSWGEGSRAATQSRRPITARRMPWGVGEKLRAKRMRAFKRRDTIIPIFLLLAGVVHAGNVQDRAGAKELLTKAQGRLPRLQRLGAAGG